MIKNCFSHKIDGKEGFFICDHDLQTIQAKEMLFQFLKIIGMIEDKAQMDKKAEEERLALESSNPQNNISEPVQSSSEN
jgi:hypothetical protein